MDSRQQFETSQRFRGMDFTRSATHPEYYESPYANGAWDGWQASRESLVVELPEVEKSHAWMSDYDDGCAYGRNFARSTIEYRLKAQGIRTK